MLGSEFVRKKRASMNGDYWLALLTVSLYCSFLGSIDSMKPSRLQFSNNNLEF